MSLTIQQAFKKNRSALTDKISHCVRDRFDDLETMDVMKGSRILDFNLWPTEELVLETFGDLEISLMVEISISAIPTEWNSFKHYWKQTLQGNTDVWPLLLTCYHEKFPNLCHLIEIIHVFRVSNAKVERGFSTMRRIKTDWRSRLAEETLDHLMRISIDGVPLSEFNPIPVVQQFFSKPRRTDTLPYGSSKRPHSQIEIDD